MSSFGLLTSRIFPDRWINQLLLFCSYRCTAPGQLKAALRPAALAGQCYLNAKHRHLSSIFSIKHLIQLTRPCIEVQSVAAGRSRQEAVHQNLNRTKERSRTTSTDLERLACWNLSGPLRGRLLARFDPCSWIRDLYEVVTASYRVGHLWSRISPNHLIRGA